MQRILTPPVCVQPMRMSFPPFPVVVESQLDARRIPQLHFSTGTQGIKHVSVGVNMEDFSAAEMLLLSRTEART